MKDTKIEWADHTLNFYMGCHKVSAGCKNCYMHRILKEQALTVKPTKHDMRKQELARWPASVIFVNSMSDTFEESLSETQVMEMFQIMYEYPKHTYLILTKRIERAMNMINSGVLKIPDNFWIGTSIENNDTLSRIRWLQSTNCKNKFVSFEPLLEDLTGLVLEMLHGIGWMIVGGESDYTKPRGMSPEWVTRLKRSADHLNIPFFFKQWGGSFRCECHGAWGCRMFEGATHDNVPKRGIDNFV